jgi:hypothetical protein
MPTVELRKTRSLRSLKLLRGVTVNDFSDCAVREVVSTPQNRCCGPSSPLILDSGIRSGDVGLPTRVPAH